MTDHENFRPILLLPWVPKIIVKVIQNQNMDNLTENGVFCRY